MMHLISSAPSIIALFHPLSINETKSSFDICLKTNNIGVLCILLDVANRSTITTISINQLIRVIFLPKPGYMHIENLL